jgi:hypothetical protein
MLPKAAAAVGVLRRGWINFDRVWLCALVLTGSWMIAAA